MIHAASSRRRTCTMDEMYLEESKCFFNNDTVLDVSLCSTLQSVLYSIFSTKTEYTNDRKVERYRGRKVAQFIIL